MRIGIDATALYGRYGGVEYALWNLLCALCVEDEENEYCIYIPADGPPRELLAAFPKRWRWLRLPFRGDEKWKRIAWQQTILPFRLRADKCDLLHAPTYVSPLKCLVPVVLTVYDLIALSHPNFATPLNRLHYGALLPRSIKGASRVIAPSQAVADEIAARFPNTRTRVVPLGLEPIFFQAPSTPDTARVRARYDLPEPYLLFVGNFEPKKNLDNLLRALKLLPNAPPLVVAGGNRAWPQNEMTRHAAWSTPERSSSEKASRVRLIGYVARADLPALYAGCHAFVFPSLAEGFGLPVLEALACGAPTITSSHVPLGNLESAALICDARDPKEIADCIRGVLQDEGERARLQEAGKNYARPFTWRRAARETMRIYGEVEL